MTVTELVGCIFITFGPPAALFIITVAQHPLRVILMMASAFFWLLSLLFSSIIWYAAVPLRQTYVFGLMFSIAFQELFRFLFYFLLRKAKGGLEVVANQGQPTPKPLNMMSIYYVCGLGYGIVNAAFATVNLFRDLSGPGTIGILGDSKYFFVISAFTALGFVLLHIFWGVIFMGSLDTDNKLLQSLGVIGVVGSHFLVSGLTLLNQRKEGHEPVYSATITIVYIMSLIMGFWAYRVAARSRQTLLVNAPTHLRQD